MRVGQRPLKKHNPWSGLTRSLIRISQRQSKIRSGENVIGRAKIRQGRLSTAKTHERDTPILMKDRRSAAEFEGLVISQERLLVASKVCEHEAQPGIVASPSFPRNSCV